MVQHKKSNTQKCSFVKIKLNIYDVHNEHFLFITPTFYPTSVFEHKLSFFYLSLRLVFTLVLFALELEIFLNLNFKLFEEKWNIKEPRWSSGNSNCSRYKWTRFRNCFATSYTPTRIYPSLGRNGITGPEYIGPLTVT